MSVIVSRALPDVRDGLKPVHRRILYSMFDQGLRPDRPHVKCAEVVGEVMGTFHPHGDTAIYDALVRMVQDFSMRHPLDRRPRQLRRHRARTRARRPCATPSAGSRRSRSSSWRGSTRRPSTSSRTTPNTAEEPVVLPARFPNLLVNGSQGIAVGMATNIPPHNLGEVIDATLHLLEHPDATPDDLMAFVKGPDFPTGALILGAPGDPRRLPHRPRLGPDAGGRRDRGEPRRRPASSSPSSRTRPRSSRSRSRSHDLVRSGELDGHRRASRTTRRRAQAAARHPLEARRQRQRRAQQALQAHAAADELRREHAGPRRRRAAHAQPRPGARRTTSPTRSRSSPGAPSTGCARPRPAPTSSRDCCEAIDMLDAVIATIRASDDRAGGTRRADGRAVLVHRGAGEPHPRHDARPPHPARAHRARGGDGEAAGDDRRAQAILADDAKLRGVIAEEIGRDPRQVRRPSAAARSSTIPASSAIEDLDRRRGDRGHHDARPAT